MTEEVTEISDDLWNEAADAMDNEAYQRSLMEQYKICVEISDRISARRSWLNTFFITVNTVVLGTIGLSLSRSSSVPQAGLLLITLFGLLFLCYAWLRLAQSYRHLTKVKSAVIKALESRLPCNITWLTEKNQIGRKSNALAQMEILLPFFFAILYVFAYVYMNLFVV